jgi:hypothetical protein
MTAPYAGLSCTGIAGTRKGFQGIAGGASLFDERAVCVGDAGVNAGGAQVEAERVAVLEGG